MGILVNIIAAIMLTVLPFTAPCACDTLTLFCQCSSDNAASIEVDGQGAASSSKGHSCCGYADSVCGSDANTADDKGTQTPDKPDHDPNCPEKKQGSSSLELSAASAPALVHVDVANFSVIDIAPLMWKSQWLPESPSLKPEPSLAWPTSYATPPPLGLVYARTQRLLL